MNDRISANLLGMLVLILGAAAGCQSEPGAGAPKAVVRLEVVPSKGVCVPQVEAYVAGEGLVVRGKVRRTPENCCAATQGTLALLLVGPDGQVVDRVITSLTPRHIPRTRTRSSWFAVTLPYVPAEDFGLRIAYVPD